MYTGQNTLNNKIWAQEFFSVTTCNIWKYPPVQSKLSDWFLHAINFYWRDFQNTKNETELRPIYCLNKQKLKLQYLGYPSIEGLGKLLRINYCTYFTLSFQKFPYSKRFLRKLEKRDNASFLGCYTS